MSDEEKKKKPTPWQERSVHDYEQTVMQQCRTRLMRLPLRSRQRVVRYLAEAILDEERGPVAKVTADSRQLDHSLDGQAGDKQLSVKDATELPFG